MTATAAARRDRPVQTGPCPVCDGTTRALFTVHGHTIRHCPHCDHRFAADAVRPDHVGAVYGDDYFTGGGAGYPDYLAGAAMLRAHGRRYGQLVRPYLTPGRVLDVGAAAGFVLQGLADAGWQGVGLEPNAAMAAHARGVLGLDVRVGTLEAPGDLRADDPGAGDGAHPGFDLVAMIQVVAHFHDLRTAFENARRLTRPGGCWLIETWDSSSLSARLLGRRWHEYSPPSVLHMFSRGSLTRLAAAFDMEPVAGGRPAKRISGAHVKSLLGYKLGAGAAAAPLRAALRLLPDRVELPYPSEDLFWTLFRRRAA